MRAQLASLVRHVQARDGAEDVSEVNSQQPVPHMHAPKDRCREGRRSGGG